MTTKTQNSTLWKFKILRTGKEVQSKLVAVWEVTLDPISDDYTPEEISARDLFRKWAKRVREEYPTGLIPIHWFVDVKGSLGTEGEFATFEFMPFQYEHLQRFGAENFLTFFTWPENVETREPLSWFELPVIDKLWRRTQADKGGFIQELTCWKPSVLQPYVYLSSLEQAAR